MARVEERPCPLCGEPVVRDARRCDNCGADLEGADSPAVRAFVDSLKVDEDTARKLVDSGYRPPEESLMDEAGRAAASSTLYLCPSCGAFVSSADARCPRCGADLAMEATPAAEGRSCPSCGSTIPITAEVCPACRKPVGPTEEDAIPGLCPNCGSVAPTGRQTCAVCGASLRPARAPPERRREATRREPPAPPPAPREDRPESPAPARPAVRPRSVPPPSLREVRDAPAPAARPLPPPPEPEAPIRAASAPPPRPRREGVRRSPRLPADGRPPEPRTASLREVSAATTLLAVPAAAAAGAAEVPGSEWGALFAFGLLFGVAVGLTAPDLRQPLRHRPTLAALLAGLSLLVAAPALGYAGAASAVSDGVLLAAGTAIVLGLAWRFRPGVGPLLPWIAGLLLLTALAVSPFIAAPLRPPGSDTGLGFVGGALAVGAAAFVVVRRWLRATAHKRLARGDAAYARREFEKAVGAYDAAVAVGRRAGIDIPAGWYGKGAALVAAGRFDEAITALDRALALNPGNEIAWINKGTALTHLGRMRDALKCYNAAIKANPAYEVAWNNKANALARLGKTELALACYEKALEIDPAYRTAWVNKGFVLAKLGRFDEAAACADAALRLTTGAAASA